MPELPDIFIQIHYHLRPGGVSTVIKRYVETFNQCKATNTRCYVISSCQGINEEDYAPAQLIDIEECGYQSFASKEQFIALRDLIFQKIDSQFAAIGEKKVLVVAHNLTLAKNPALSSAIRLLAIKWSSPQIRFFSVIHDFSEEGRADLMAQIINLESLGIPIRDELYCTGVPVHYVVPNRNSFDLLSQNHFPVTLLQNPISSRKTAEISYNRADLLNKLKKIATQSQITLDTEKRIFYYPVRLISRKNIFEAIVLTCIACDGTLLAGPAGKGTVDNKRFNVIQSFIIKNRLSVLFNAGDAVTKIYPGATDPVSQLLNICDMVVSSSIAEGFGYSLYEPWIYGKSVIARKPTGFVTPDGWNDSALYSWFPVPEEWVSFDELELAYKTQYYRCYKEDLSWNIKENFCVNSTVDFGALNEKMQMQIVENVLNDPIKLSQWKDLLGTSSKYWPGISTLINAAQNSSAQHEDLINTQFSEELFKKQFSECYSQLPSCIPNNADFLSIQEKFQSPHFFRLLLNPELM
jgi:hypothetical protein